MLLASGHSGGYGPDLSEVMVTTSTLMRQSPLSPLSRLCRLGPLMRFCRMDSATTIRHIQRQNLFRAQFGRGLPPDLVAPLVLEHPLATLGVEADPDLLATPLQTHGVRPIGQRDLALPVHQA